jgi:long-chain acyl-CoA synthetase
MIMSAENATVMAFLNSVASKYGTRPALWNRTFSKGCSHWSHISFNEVFEQAKFLAAILCREGLQKGDRVLIPAQSCSEFAVGFFATLLAGGVVVSLDIRLSLADQKYMADFSDATWILSLDTDTHALSKNLIEVAASPLNLINVPSIFTTQDIGIPLDDFFSIRCCALPDLAIIAFTSGTTSQPKGVMLSWANLVHQIETLSEHFCLDPVLRALSILPLHHMFELSAGLLLPFSQGGSIYYANSLMPQQILAFIRDLKITNMLVVPLFLKALKKGILVEVSSSKTAKLWFQTTFALARWLPFQWLRRCLFFPLHRKLGYNLHELISGASSLDQRISRFFEILGIAVYEGYGLTETSPVIACNSRRGHKPGSIGRPLRGVEIRFDPITREILAKGPNIMLGYYKNPSATANCMTSDGWFKTGDAGELSEDSFLTIVGRHKDIIVLGNGKKVAPAEIELYFQELPEIQDICILGQISSRGPTKDSEVVTAIVVPAPGLGMSTSELEVRLVQYAQALSYYKRPSQFIFMDEPLPKTSTMKIKKHLVKELLLQRMSQ